MTSTITYALNENLVSSSEAPTVIFLHGYGASVQSIAGLSQVLPSGTAWAAPRGPLEVSASGFAWAPITIPGNPDPKHVAIGTQALWRWIDSNVSATSPLIPVGFSQGGLMASQLLRTRPERVLTTTILAGFTVNATQPGDQWLTEHKPRVMYCRGDADTVITPAALERTATWLAGHTDADLHIYSGLAHTIDHRVAADLSEFLGAYLT